jgi:hypothetical protein
MAEPRQLFRVVRAVEHGRVGDLVFCPPSEPLLLGSGPDYPTAAQACSNGVLRHETGRRLCVTLRRSDEDGKPGDVRWLPAPTSDDDGFTMPVPPDPELLARIAAVEARLDAFERPRAVRTSRRKAVR